MIIPIPPGTIIMDVDSEEILGDLVNNDDEIVVCKGGNGGSIILLCDPNSLGLGELNFIKIFPNPTEKYLKHIETLSKHIQTYTKATQRP